ncbi:MAG TPA: alpha/beta hydrolase [Casimicrobiaceae bacterium]|nr:alpha/beta hydrolase [Casimicrobiaceae bacterium]
MTAMRAAKFIARCLGCLAFASAAIGAGGAPNLVPTQRNVVYGSDRAERYDVYAPHGVAHAPVVFFVHGGSWAHGDKASPGLLDAKLGRWLPEGYVVISVDYPLLPATQPPAQAREVARALAYAQARAAEYGADPWRFIVMGHSAGAHLVALIAASPTIASDAGIVAPGAYVLLDTAALDVTALMQSRHLRLYERAFGTDPGRWAAESPMALLARKGPPMLVVCSTRRRISCPDARQFVAKAKLLGTAATLLEEDLRHAEINRTLGDPSAYTDAVDAFMRDSVTPGASMR